MHQMAKMTKDEYRVINVCLAVGELTKNYTWQVDEWSSHTRNARKTLLPRRFIPRKIFREVKSVETNRFKILSHRRLSIFNEVPNSVAVVTYLPTYLPCLLLLLWKTWTGEMYFSLQKILSKKWCYYSVKVLKNNVGFRYTSVAWELFPQ